MKSSLVIACAATLAALGASAAQARDADVQWSVTIGSPAYGPPAPVIVAPPVYRVPPPVVVYPQYRPIRYQAPTHWDRDGDGIPNRYDRFYNPPWDRDGDGIPNRYDRYDNYPYGDRDRDGVPNRWDRHDNPYGDRDRDGVPNRWDRHDQNPWRR